MTAKPQNSIIATFDLLGISAIMNSASMESIGDVVASIDNAFLMVKDGMREIFEDLQTSWKAVSGKRCRLWDDIIKRTSIKFFSDTIVISQVLSKKPTLEAAMFVSYVSIVMVRLFNNGFPARCCIDVGPVAIKNNIILGRPYIVSLKCAESLDLCGAVLTEDAYFFFVKSLQQATMHTDILKQIFRVDKLEIPTKNGCKTMACLNWLAETTSGDLRQLLCDAFSAHNKVMTEDAWRKLDNTERMMRSFLYHRHHTT